MIFIALRRYLFLGCCSILLATSPVRADLTPFYQDSGRISVVVNALGTNDPAGGSLEIRKPLDSTVKKAFLLAASYGGRVINDGDVLLDGNAVVWTRVISSDLVGIPKFFYSAYADVTDLVKSTIDAAPGGPVAFHVKEVNTTTLDGTILVVIYSGPSFTEKGAIFLFGGQGTDGDSFIINLTESIDPNAVGAFASAGLGISYSYQNNASQQYSLVDVNGQRLTSSAGGEDDGISENGGLITVGGEGDLFANPAPFAPPVEPRTDDELYDLKPFIDATDRSILVSTLNPSNDDNIFFAYFVTSVPSAVLPPVLPPGGRSLATADFIGTVDPALPTIVLTHGLQEGPYNPENATQRTDLWTSFADKKAGALLQGQLGSNANILQYTWEEAFQGAGGRSGKAYIKARSYVADAAAQLARRLFEELGAGYDQPVHFIGHSLGTAVNAYAARDFLNLQPAVQKAQVTVLDYPNRVTKIPGINDKEEEIYGFDEDFFAGVLPLDREPPALRLDNYYAKPVISSAGVGTAILGSVYNHIGLVNPNDLDNPVFDDEGVDNDHSGVQQWYRWTINPNGLYPGVCNQETGELERLRWNFDDSLNPCKQGWYWSINGPKPGGYPAKFPERGTALKITKVQELRIENFTDFGCEIKEVTPPYQEVYCKEKSSPFATGDVVIPEEAAYLGFKYRYNNRGDGDYAAVLLDETPIWIMGGESALEGEDAEAGPIPISAFRGERKITFALYGVGDKNAELTLSQFQVFAMEMPGNTAPIADAGEDQMVFVGGGVDLDGGGSYDPDGDELTYAWKQTGGEVVDLMGEETAYPTFVPAEVGLYTFTLEVSDGEAQASDDVNVKVTYDFEGFFDPVANEPEWNTATAGRAIPMKFSLNGNKGLDILDEMSPVSKNIACAADVGVGVEEGTKTAGKSKLQYDAASDLYTYVWKTERAWSGTCREFVLKLKDDTEYSVLFEFAR